VNNVNQSNNRSNQASHFVETSKEWGPHEVKLEQFCESGQKPETWRAKCECKWAQWEHNNTK
jgi:hypothetical protein